VTSTLRKKILVYENNGIFLGKKISVFDESEQIRVLSNPIAWRIMKVISNNPKYPAQIAKELNIYEQSAYYYIRKLVRIGAIEEVRTDLVRGGTARLYQASSPSFGIEMNWGENPLSFQTNSDQIHQAAIKFFNEYVINNLFHGLIIVGAPDPHGPYKSSARDGHYAVHLAFFLGTISNLPPEFLVKLDVNAKAEKVLDGRNLISIGGPGTNIVTAEFNRYLPIRFNEENFWSGLIERSGRVYNMDNHGLIAKIKNPYNIASSIIVIAGVRSIGTKSAIIALTNYSDEILKNYNKSEEWALIVQGFDMNSDGKIDHVDVVSSTY